MNTVIKLPLYAKVSLILVGVFLVVNTLYIAQSIFLPFIYALIISVLISPLVDFLIDKKINKTFSIFIVLGIIMIMLITLLAMISSQVSRFSEALPQLEIRFQELIKQTTIWLSNTFNITMQDLNNWFNAAKNDLITNSNSTIANALNSMSGMLAGFLLLPVYIFMFLHYKRHLVNFLHQVFGPKNKDKVNDILSETKTIIQSYLFGLFVEFLIIAVLNSVGLLILRIDYAIFLGLAGALLNVIPYLGGLIAVGLFALIALVTKSPAYALYVIALYAVVQFIDNNFIVPKIVGSKVKLNALISLITVILGAALWGIPGMFLSIPLTAILKVIFDRINSLKPLGFLFGDMTNVQ